MRGLDCIEVKISPSYHVAGSGIEGQLNITVKYNGEEYHNVENLWLSDAISVLDYCFDRSKHIIHAMIAQREEWMEGKKCCRTCANGFEGICTECAGDNFGHATEIGGEGYCANWKERKK